MIRRPPRSTRTDTLFPYTTLFRSLATGVYTVGSDLAVQLKFGRLASNRPRARPLNPLSNFYRSADEHWFVHNPRRGAQDRSEEHTSELQSLMRNSYAVFCLKKKTKKQKTIYQKNMKY